MKSQWWHHKLCCWILPEIELSDAPKNSLTRVYLQVLGEFITWEPNFSWNTGISSVCKKRTHNNERSCQKCRSRSYNMNHIIWIRKRATDFIKMYLDIARIRKAKNCRCYGTQKIRRWGYDYWTGNISAMHFKVLLW